MLSGSGFIHHLWKLLNFYLFLIVSLFITVKIDSWRLAGRDCEILPSLGAINAGQQFISRPVKDSSSALARCYGKLVRIHDYGLLKVLIHWVRVINNHTSLTETFSVKKSLDVNQAVGSEFDSNLPVCNRWLKCLTCVEKSPSTPLSMAAVLQSGYSSTNIWEIFSHRASTEKKCIFVTGWRELGNEFKNLASPRAAPSSKIEKFNFSRFNALLCLMPDLEVNRISSH